ncbi:Actin [Hexamita inflata]|uniref:Actin n=1 Tax=Hexamita inflata TaxID=28002 RepID=A0AA86U8Y9_9EUKA|nr:Actin [Hexamita inflata]
MTQPTLTCIDSGSANTYLGLVGDNAPRATIATVAGKPRHAGVQAGLDSAKTYVGDELDQKRNLFRMTYPLEKCQIVNWDDMREIWRHSFQNELRLDASDCVSILSEHPRIDFKARAEICRTFFESYSVKGFYIQNAQILAMIGSGQTTGVTLDIGEGMAHAVPIYEGCQLFHAMRRSDFSGRELTDSLFNQLKQLEPQFPQDISILRDIKEKLCYVQSKSKPVQQATYELPDSFQLKTKALTLTNPCEVPEMLFSGQNAVQNLILNSIEACDVDVQADLERNIVLSGGSTKFEGFAERLQTELQGKRRGIEVNALEDRQYATFVGQSVLGCLDTFKDMYVTAAEYAEQGAEVINRRWL